MPNAAKKIAIIGGGVSGASTLIQLVKAAPENAEGMEITIFSTTPHIGPGPAYAPEVANRFLLNHEMHDMGGIDPRRNVGLDDFFNWVQQHLPELQHDYPDFDLTNRDEYVPRNLYGKYVRARYEEAKKVAEEKHITLHEEVAMVKDVRQLRQKVEVRYKNAAILNDMYDHFDDVVLALGHAYAPSSKQIEGSGHFCKPHQAQAFIERGELDGKSVIIQGAGQYADEIALAALDAGATNVKMVSRHGWIHAVRGKYVPYERKFLTVENLEKMAGGSDKPFRLLDVVALFKKEMEHGLGTEIDWQEVWEPKNIPEKLSRDIFNAEHSKELKWRSVLLSLKDIRQEIFERLDPADREQFTKEYRALFFSYQAPIPLRIAKKLLKAMQDGKLEVLGGWQTSQWEAEKQKMVVQRVKKGGGSHSPEAGVEDDNIERLEADYLISANGQTLDPEHVPLLKTMIGHGTLLKNPSGGIRINTANQRAISEEGEAAHLFALGPITNGDRLINSNSHVSMESAKTVAANIIEDLEISPGTSRDGSHRGAAR